MRKSEFDKEVRKAHNKINAAHEALQQLFEDITYSNEIKDIFNILQHSISTINASGYMLHLLEEAVSKRKSNEI